MKHPRELQGAVAALLRTEAAGQAVALEIGARHRAWQDRALIGSLRARRALDRHDREAEDQDQARLHAMSPSKLHH